MRDELSDRQAAIRRRLAGESIAAICQSLQRSEMWFHKWWQRYLEHGPEGLYDLTRANQHVVNRTPPQVERAVISIRRRLAARATVETRYNFVGAATVRSELEALGYSPLPALRTIEAIVARAGLTCPPLRLARRLAQSEYPTMPARDSNELHQVDSVGPRHLQGDRTDYYILICRDVCDGAVYAELVTNRETTTVIQFLIHAWQSLGLPTRVQFDNGREFCGFGQAARWLSRAIRFCLLVGVEPVFIPKGRPQRNGAIENYNGWFQPLLLGRHLRRPADLRRELRHVVDATNEQHVRPQLGYKTTAQYRRGKRLRKLPAKFTLNLERLPITAGKVIFIRCVSADGQIDVLEQDFRVGKRLKFQYVKAVLDTQRQRLKVYHNGRLIKTFIYELRKD
jgi:transposase InsO family protein